MLLSVCWNDYAYWEWSWILTIRGGQTTSYLRPIPLPSTQQFDDQAYLSRGQCLLPLTFGKIAVEGSIFENDHPFTLGGRDMGSLKFTLRCQQSDVVPVVNNTSGTGGKICHRCSWHQRQNLVNLDLQNLKCYFQGLGGRWFMEKNLKPKISWHCPFLVILT